MDMKRPSIFLLAALALLAAACGGGEAATSTSVPDSTTVSDVPATTTTTAPADTSSTTATPATTIPEEPTIPTSEPKPAPGDVRGAIFVTGKALVFLESDPVQVRLDVSAQLPTPCHEAVWDVEDDGETITVDLYTTVDPDLICADVIQDVELQIDLGAFELGETRSVILNGEGAGEFTL